MTTRRQQQANDQRAAQAALRRQELGLALDDLEDTPVRFRAQTLLALYQDIERGTTRLDRQRHRSVRVAARKANAIIRRIVPAPTRTPAQRRQAAYWPLVGAPPTCGPGELWRARAFYDRLLAATEAPESEHWSRGDKASLRVQLWRWGKRANGQDARFTRYGNVPGRLAADRRWTLALETIIWSCVADDDRPRDEKPLDARADEAETTPSPLEGSRS